LYGGNVGRRKTWSVADETRRGAGEECGRQKQRERVRAKVELGTGKQTAR